jgi:hypothetical protein
MRDPVRLVSLFLQVEQAVMQRMQPEQRTGSNVKPEFLSFSTVAPP